MAITFLVLAASAAVGGRILAAPRDLTNTRVDVRFGESVEVVFSLPSGFLALSDPLSFRVRISTGCSNSVSPDCRHVTPPNSALIDVPENSRVELTALVSGHFVITTGYHSQECCSSLEPLNTSDLPFRDPSGACHVPLSSAHVRSSRSNAPKQFAMTAAPTRILRGRYVVDTGDYVNVFFSNGHGFIVVSEPAPSYYVNVGSGCQDPGSDACQWYHSPWNGPYVMTGSAGSVCQVVPTGPGVLQLTIGYLDHDCCESIFGIAEGRGSISWPVSAGTAACFIHTVTNGTMALNFVTVGPNQEVRGYDHHSMIERLTSTGAIYSNPGLGALMLDNSDSSFSYVFELGLLVTDWRHIGLNIGYVDVRFRVSAPAVMLGDLRGDTAAWETLPRGACEDSECTTNDTDGVGRTDGVPTASDGDPIYESEASGLSSAALLAIVIAVLVVGPFIVGVPCFLCRRGREVRRDAVEEELDEQAIQVMSSGPTIEVGNQEKAYPGIYGPQPPTRSYVPTPPYPPAAYPYRYGAPAPAAELPEPQVPYPGCPPTHLGAGQPTPASHRLFRNE
jgi:hypothetical protein